MTEDQQHLWDKIKNFELDEPTSSLTFTGRLARENGWSMEFTIRAVYEYKKFIFLLCAAGQSLTPSDQVDQVWHLHLLYTQSYWVDFCQHTLGTTVHHGPTKGGKMEGERFNALYEETLCLYEELFGRKPPEDIWPPSKIRFGEINFQRVNLDSFWMIKKPRLFRK